MSGRDASRAEARYRLESEGFRGRVAIVMGAKNMTMTEVQVARRLGTCTQTPPNQSGIRVIRPAVHTVSMGVILLI